MGGHPAVFYFLLHACLGRICSSHVLRFIFALCVKVSRVLTGRHHTHTHTQVRTSSSRFKVYLYSPVALYFVSINVPNCYI